ncbi:hypothetical protein BDP55DRAFT_685583, partial [Colletotrichum godetiae]
TTRVVPAWPLIETSLRICTMLYPCIDHVTTMMTPPTVGYEVLLGIAFVPRTNTLR